MDNGTHIFLTIFDQAKVGGGDTVYQIVNQIERPKIVDGKPNRRFDITLLINGLPIIQMELKRALNTANEALNQMEQYIEERQYTDIFSTLQILIAMTPHDIKYMANTKRGSFNKAFAFSWQDERTSRAVTDWKEFSDKVLSIPMAHDMSTRYMILDGTKNKESIKVMRPYQVYATKRVLDKVSSHDFSYGEGKLGYVWHTTGSGKTITSFKTAWLSSRLPNVDKVVFLVDRIALTNQTADAYNAYDPQSHGDSGGVVTNTANISDLKNKLTRKVDKNIIVTSIQKMSRYVSHPSFKPLNKNILFIVDEAHRSTGDGRDSEAMLERIREKIHRSAWIGYTGTPKFPETTEIFGENLHAYTIKEAISDGNVLGFNVEFKETIKPPENPTEDDIDDMKKASIYDSSEEHIKLVVEDIVKNWKIRSNEGKYNALLTVHVGGNKPSTPRAMEYFNEFERVNKELPEEDRLKVAVSFSVDTSNGDNMVENNKNLSTAIKHYNSTFGTSFDMTTIKEYSEDLARRLNKSADDRNYLDLAIVVDQLLTGFDAPEMNTLYVDRTLKGANLIQAYSRTNRIHNKIDKPWGNVINYRWPRQNEEEMNRALALYSNADNALKQMDIKELIDANKDTGVISKTFEETARITKILVEEIRKTTEDFSDIPKSERECEDLAKKMKQYTKLISQLKQYSIDSDGKDVSIYVDPDGFYEKIGITQDEEVKLTTVIANKVKEKIAEIKKIDISEVDLSLVHIHDVRINYDYLVDLIAKMSDRVNENNMASAEKIFDEIMVEIAKIDDDRQRRKIEKFVNKILRREWDMRYPSPTTVEEMNNEIEESHHDSNIKVITNFIRHWGLDNSISPDELDELISKHKEDQDDLDKQDEITNMMKKAHGYYKEIAAPEVREKSWIAYRRDLRIAVYELAERIVRGE